MHSVRTNVLAASPGQLRLKFTGKKSLLPNGHSGFFTKIQRLCTEAALAGSINIKVLKRFYGPSAHKRTLGLHVTAPQPQGIPLIWQESSDSIIRMIMGVPQGENPHELCAALKNVLGRWAGKEEQTTEEMVRIQPKPDTNKVLSRILDETEDASEPPREEAIEQEPVGEPQVSAPEASRTDPAAYVKFMQDPESIELFLIEMAGYANKRGEFPTAQAVEVLREQFGFPRVRSSAGGNFVYNALWRLARSGKLEKLDYGYRIPKPVFDRLKGRVAESPPASTPQETAHETIPAGVLTAAQLRAEIERLSALADAYNAARGRQAAIQAEIEEVRAKLKPLQERENELECELAGMSQTLSDPTAKEAAEELTIIRKLLGIE